MMATIREIEIIIKNNDITELKSLIDSGMDINIKGDYKDTLLILAIKYKCSLDLIKYLLTTKDHNGNTIDIDAQATIGFTALHYAVQNNNPELLSLLLAKKPNLELQLIGNYKGQTPLLWATNFPNVTNNIQLLIKAGADLTILNTYTHKTFLMYALQYYSDLIPFYIAHGLNINQTNSIGNSALHYAVKHKNFKAIKLLLANGANVNLKNDDGETPICEILDYDNIKDLEFNIFKLLINNNAELDFQLPKYSNKYLIEYLPYTMAQYLVQHTNVFLPMDILFDFSTDLDLRENKSTYAQCVFSYFLKHKDKYTKNDVEQFKSKFSDMYFLTDDDITTLLPIVKFL